MVVLRTTSTGHGHSWMQRFDTDPTNTLLTVPRPREPTINKSTCCCCVKRGIRIFGSPHRICSSLEICSVRRCATISSSRSRAVLPCGYLPACSMAELIRLGDVDNMGSDPLLSLLLDVPPPREPSERPPEEAMLLSPGGTADNRIRWSDSGLMIFWIDQSNNLRASSLPSYASATLRFSVMEIDIVCLCVCM